jgi:hypothetical protein
MFLPPAAGDDGRARRADSRQDLGDGFDGQWSAPSLISFTLPASEPQVGSPGCCTTSRRPDRRHADLDARQPDQGG